MSGYDLFIDNRTGTVGSRETLARAFREAQRAQVAEGIQARNVTARPESAALPEGEPAYPPGWLHTTQVNDQPAGVPDATPSQDAYPTEWLPPATDTPYRD